MRIFKSQAFTLIELLIVLAIISLLIGIIIVVSKPQDTFQKSRDTKREADLKNIEKLFFLISSHDTTFNQLNYVSPNTLYLSLQDSSSTCGSYLSQLPSLPSGWSYRCSATPTDITGQGWIPIPFSSNPLINASQLPTDPINKPPYYYTFTANNQGYELTAKRENKDEEIIVSNLTSRLTPISRGGTWLKVFAASDQDIARSIERSNDGGYLIFGNTYSCCAGNYDIFLLKLDSAGNYQWSKAIGDIFWDTVYTSVKTDDGGYLLGGYTSSYGAINGDTFIIKLDANGSVSWAKKIGGSNQEYIQAIDRTSDGGYLAVGYISSGNGDILVMKLTANGDVSWARAIGGSSSSEIPYFVREVSDGSYLITGSTANGQFLLKIDSNGSILWSKVISDLDVNGLINYIDEIGNNESYLVFYSGLGFWGSSDLAVLNFTSTGSLIWARMVGNSADNYFRSAIKTQDGNYFLTGNHILKINNNGEVLLAKSFNGFIYKSYQNSDGSYVSVGHYNQDILTAKFNSNISISKCSFLNDTLFSSIVFSPAVSNISFLNSSLNLQANVVNISNVPSFNLGVTNFCPSY